MDKTNEPVLLSGVISAAFISLVALATVMGWVDWNAEQIDAIQAFFQAVLALGVVAAPIVGAYVARARVTPVANPRDNTGRRLIPDPNE